MNKNEKEVLQNQLDSEKQTINELKQIYRQALNDVDNKISLLSARADMNPPELQSIIYQKQYQQAIKGQLEGIMADLQSNEYATISDYLTRCYHDGYVGTMYDIQGQGIPLIVPINQEQITKAIQIDTKLSKPLYAKLGEDVNKLKTSIRAEISRGIANGSTWNDVAAKISKSMVNTPFRKAYNNSLRIARTEGHRIQNQAALDAQYKAKEKGADIVKQWDATLDNNTRDNHRILDGQIKEVDEPFEVSGMKVDAPGMFGTPSEDCNCRCTLLQRARWALDEDELQTLKERAEFFGLDKTEDFEEYKRKYLGIKEEDVDSRNFKELTLEEFKKMQHSITKEERSIVYGKGHFDGYINSSNARKMNEVLRNNGTLSDYYQRIADTLQNLIDKNVLSDDIMVTRYVHGDALESLIGIKTPTYNLRMSKDDFWNAIESLPSQFEKGTTYVEKGFLSTSGVASENVMTDKLIKLNIKAPKDTNCYITTNNKESEIIFGQNTKLKITDCTIENSRQAGWKIVLDCIIE